MQLSNEAADVLNDVLMEHFSLISSRVVQIIKLRDSCKDGKVVTPADVKKIVKKISKDVHNGT